MCHQTTRAAISPEAPTTMTDGGEPAAPCRGFPVFSLQSLRLIADQTGVPDISDDVLLLISEDMTYRVREMISNSMHFTRHSCRTKLTIHDVDKALQFASVDFCGSCSAQDREPQYVHESGIYFVPHEEADLIGESEELIRVNNKTHTTGHCSPPSIHWLMVDGRLVSKCSEELSSAQSVPKVSASLVTYYECLLKAILSDDLVEQSVALRDLSTNDRIQPIIGHVVNALQTHVKSAEFLPKSSSAIVNAFCKILTNPSLLIAHPQHLKTIQDTLMDMVLMPGQDCFLMRQRAATALSLLCDVSNTYSHIFDHDPQSSISSRLQNFVSSFSAADLSALTGVLLTCLTCGSEDRVLDYLRIMAQMMQTLDFRNEHNMRTDVQHLLPGVAGCLMTRLLRDTVIPDFSAFTRYYQLFYEYFSDSFTCFLLLLEDCAQRSPAEAMPITKVSLGWIEEKTGTDLLDSFYETSEEVAVVCGNAGATNGMSERRARESDDVSGGNSVTMSDSRKTTMPAITAACTIFENYAALPRSRSISIVMSNCRNSGGESDVAAAGTAAGHPAKSAADEIRHLPQVACGKEQRLRRLLRTSHHSCSHVSSFL